MLIYPGCLLWSVHGLTDLFRVAGERAGPSVPPIRVSHWEATDGGVACIWDSHPGADHRLAYIVSPSSIMAPAQMAAQPVAADWMHSRHAEGATLCSVCAGAFVLAETGLIDGRSATTHWAFAPLLAQRFPKVRLAEGEMVLDDGDIITAGGIFAWTDLGLTLIERLMGPAAMLAAAQFFLLDPPRGSQRPYALFQPRFDHQDEAIRRVQHRIHTDSAGALDIAELSEAAGMTPRTFLRRFTAATGLRPREYIQNVRIAKAREALERTMIPVDRIAWDVGYADPSAFRKLFQRLTAMSPAAYRAQFGIGRPRAEGAPINEGAQDHPA